MSARDDLDSRIEAIESGYEFMLAYAAQGRATDKGAAAGRNVREYLERMAAALDGLADIARRCAAEAGPELPQLADRFLAAVETDAAVALSMLRSVLSREDVSSQLVDNVNASIHLRALLTDLFVIDEAFKGPRA